ncbi:MAG: sulfatase-like hydrolase/transferase [Pirellulaceae bacterium]
MIRFSLLRTILFAPLFWICLFAPIANAAESESDTVRPNIVFFFADDQTSSSLGCYGNALAQTPNIDRLAARGVRFENAFVSHSICWVSRTTILTGLVGRAYGTASQPDVARPDAVETLYSDLLRQAGYRTGYFGKWHAKMPAGFRAEDHFDQFQAIGRNPYFKKMPDGSLRHETDLIVDKGIEFVRNQPQDQPFALNLWFNACHAEDGDRRPGIGHFAWPQSANRQFDDTQIPPPRLSDPAIFDALPDFLRTSITRERYFWRWNTPQKYQTNIRAYYRMASGIDHAIGRFLAALEEAGLADNTIIVYSADNGYHMGNRGLAGKWSHFDESLNVPLIIFDPRASTNVNQPADQPQISAAMALNVDLPATFLDWAGVPVPSRYHGRSLRPIVEGQTPDDWRTATFHEHFAVRNRIPAFEGVRTANFKYARYFDHETEVLHDLRNDPDELVNLANNPNFSQQIKELRQQTQEFVQLYGEPLEPLQAAFAASTEPYPKASANVSHQTDQDGFVSLFNGKNLNGWSGDSQYWKVEDGAITGETDGSLKMNRFLTWNGSTIRNFEIQVKVRVTAGGNSGIQYRGISRPEIDLDIVSGYQCDVVANTPEYNGMLYEERGRRILSHTGEKVIVDPTGQPWVVGKMPVHEFEPNQWHDFRILVEANHHRHWIDGHPTADLWDFDEQGRVLEGVLAVQVHVGPAMKIQYKDFRIKHLPDDLPVQDFSDHPIPTDAYGVRPQGSLPADWKPPVYGDQ